MDHLYLTTTSLVTSRWSTICAAQRIEQARLGIRVIHERYVQMEMWTYGGAKVAQIKLGRILGV
jgi:hypothetical protein